LGLKRNLRASEIVDQIVEAHRSLPDDRRITHVVLMGMGEPLANYQQTVKAIQATTNTIWGIGISPRRITLSTVGLVPQIRQLMDETNVNLAISLHAATDELRSELMPVNRKYSLRQLLDCCRALPIPRRKRITFEYVLLRGVNDSSHALLDLCFTLLDRAKITPYYFYMCDMIPGSEHWRTPLHEAQSLQHSIMGYLPGFATPRIVCDVPFVGKRWVHQLADYDTERGISYWTKNYRTSIESDTPDALTRTYEYFDPIHTLPESGQRWWTEHGRLDESALEAAEVAEASRRTAALQAH
jgi:L-lysine 2,3-aminomutase